MYTPLNNQQLEDLLFKQKVNAEEIDVSKIHLFSFLFCDIDFSQYPNLQGISQWNVSHVKSMNSCFKNARNIPSLKNWDVTNVDDMRFMFAYSDFNEDISNWDVSNVYQMSWIFYHSPFNHNIHSWVISDYAFHNGIHQMFYGNPLNDKVRWHPKRIYEYETQIFKPTTTHQLKKLLLNEDIELSRIDISGVTSFKRLFTNMDLSNPRYSYISTWDTSHVKDMDGCFAKATNIPDITNWDVSNVKSMDCMFLNSDFNQDISHWNIKNLKSVYLMFAGTKFNKDLSNWVLPKTDKNLTMLYKLFAKGNNEYQPQFV